MYNIRFALCKSRAGVEVSILNGMKASFFEKVIAADLS